MTIKEAIERATVIMKTGKIDTPKQKARLLLQYVLNKPRQYLIVYDDKHLLAEEEKKYIQYANKIKNGTPLQHITHSQEFMKMNFFVDENVLIPRADTECLVEEAIKIAKKYKTKNILELCTGSGAIAVSLAKYLDNVVVTAVDISDEALKIAKKNARQNEVEDRITFVKSDLYNSLSDNKFDMIISNPPYIKKSEIKKLNKEVQNEPTIALDGGYDGLDFYRRIIPVADEYLNHNGYICLEIGYDQKEDVEKMLVGEVKYANVYSKKDLFDKDRIVCAKLI